MTPPSSHGFRDPRRNNLFGRFGDTAAWARTWRLKVETEMLQRGAVPIDACQSIERVASDVVEVCETHGFPITEL